MANRKTRGKQGATKGQSRQEGPNDRRSLRGLVIDSDSRSGRFALALFLFAIAIQFIPWGLGLVGVVVNRALGITVLGFSPLICILAFCLLWGVSKRWAICLAVAVLGGASWVGHQIVTGRYLPNLEARLAYEIPAISIVNDSDAVAHDPSFKVLLWNLEHPETSDSLPILTPTAPGSVIRPHEHMGPQSLFDSSAVLARVSKGDRLWGAVTVSCSDCAQARGYWMYAEVGRGGWLSEVNLKDRSLHDMSTRDLIKMVPVVARDPEAELYRLAPPATRIPSLAAQSVEKP